MTHDTEADASGSPFGRSACSVLKKHPNLEILEKRMCFVALSLASSKMRAGVALNRVTICRCHGGTKDCNHGCASSAARVRGGRRSRHDGIDAVVVETLGARSPRGQRRFL